MKKILIVGDLHCGSDVAIMPPEVVEEREGYKRVHYATEDQLVMFDTWKLMCKTVGKVDAVFNMGDNIEGFNYHEHGVGNWTNNLVTQCEGALELLRMIKCSKHSMVIGSKYHVASNPSAEEYIANQLRADGDKVAVGRELIVKLEGKVFHLLHNIGFTSNPSYRATALSRELMFALLHSEELHGAKYIIRSHVHYFQAIKGYRSGACICPSWKLRDDFMKKGSLGGADMRIGYVLCTINKDEVDFQYEGTKFKLNCDVVNLG